MTAPHNQSQPNIGDEKDDLREATRLLLLWSEIPNAEDIKPGHDTFAFLGKKNSAGWVWAREVRQERDFDAEQERQRSLAIECIIAAEEESAALRAKVDELTVALRDARPLVESFRYQNGRYMDLLKRIDVALALNSQHSDGEAK